MSDDHFDPDSLADYLDSLFDGDELPTGADDPLVEAALRLSNAPKPELDPARFEMIRSQVLKANQANMAATGTPTTSSLPIPAIVAGVALVIVAILIGIYIITTQDTDSVDAPTVESLQPEVTATEDATLTPTITETVTATETATPTATETETETAEAIIVAESATPSATNTATATVTSSATSTETPSITPEPSVTPLPIQLIIEGEVEEIIGNILIIYDFEIELDPGDPLLTILQPGDLIRIDGTMEVVDDADDDAPPVILITPILVEPVTDNIQINDETGETWRDDNTCSNPPPDWAPANGWRARCEGGTAPGNSGNAPGQGGNNPGNGGNPNNCPGNSCNAPGHGGSPPGQSDDDDD